MRVCTFDSRVASGLSSSLLSHCGQRSLRSNERGDAHCENRKDPPSQQKHIDRNLLKTSGVLSTQTPLPLRLIRWRTPIAQTTSR